MQPLDNIFAKPKVAHNLWKKHHNSGASCLTMGPHKH
jgi:hypothetical protein